MAIRMIRKPSSLEEVGQITETQFNSGTYCVLVNGSMVLENEYIIAKTYNASTKYFRVIGEQVNNIDDIIPMRYAYGNQNGYVIGKGTELSHTINGLIFTINSGRIVLQGVESDIDANGYDLTIDNVANKRYFSVYYEVNLGTNTVVIDSRNDSAGYPDLDIGQDLTENSSGVARLELYRFETQGLDITNVTKVVKPIQYTGDALNDYDISQGTVEERLTRLGFNTGVAEILTENWTFVSNLDGDTVNTLTRQGKYCLANIWLEASIYADTSRDVILRLPQDFTPKEGSVGYAQVRCSRNVGSFPSIDLEYVDMSCTVAVLVDKAYDEQGNPFGEPFPQIRIRLSSADFGIYKFDRIIYIKNLGWEIV